MATDRIQAGETAKPAPVVFRNAFVPPLFVAKQMLTIMASQMPIQALQNIAIKELLLNKFAFMDHEPDFTLLAGICADEVRSFTFKPTYIYSGTGSFNETFVFSSFPLTIILAPSKGVALDGYTDFTPFLKSPAPNKDCEFCIGSGYSFIRACMDYLGENFEGGHEH